MKREIHSPRPLYHRAYGQNSFHRNVPPSRISVERYRLSDISRALELAQRNLQQRNIDGSRPGLRTDSPSRTCLVGTSIISILTLFFNEAKLTSIRVEFSGIHISCVSPFPWIPIMTWIFSSRRMRARELTYTSIRNSFQLLHHRKIFQ
jgi:hypothetical protein